MHQNLRLLLFPLLIAGCAAPQNSTTQQTHTPSADAPLKLGGLYQISLRMESSDQPQMSITRSGPLTAQSSEVNGLTFTPVSTAVFTHIATNKRYLSASFKVTNPSATSVQMPMYLPVATSGTVPTVGSTPFKNVKFFDGSDASSTATSMVIGQAKQVNTATGLVVTDSNATPYRTGLDITGLQPTLPAGTTLTRLFNSGWVGNALPAGGSQIMTFGLEIPKATDPKKDPFTFDLMFTVADGATPMNKWSNPATWGGTVPTSGDVTIPAGKTVLLDQNVNLNSLTVLGELRFADQDISLSAGYIMLHGKMSIGSAAQAFKSKATITLNATNTAQDIMGMGTRGLLVMGGKLEVYGTPPSPTWTKLGANASAAQSSLTLLQNTNWKAGDNVVVAPTDFYGGDGNGYPVTNPVVTEKFTLGAAASAQTINLGAGLKASRWGMLQYATDNGMSLTPGTLTLPSTAARDFGTLTIPTTLDERAEVGNLSRNVVIQGADDTLWQQQQFGGQIMIMGPDSSANLVGVELRRMGQAGHQGRYPIHLHLMSYNTSGQVLAEARVQVRDSAIWNSAQRCVVIHGTNGAVIRNNICYDIRGDAMFIEDGVERRNTLENNLVLNVRAAYAGKELTRHEMNYSPGIAASASGFWITNPDNIIRGNVVADARSNGFWYGIPEKPMGVNKAVAMYPMNLPFGVFEKNTAHSNGQRGLMFAWGPADAAGNPSAADKYNPTDTGTPTGTQLFFTMRNNTYTKNLDGREVRVWYVHDLGVVSAGHQQSPHFIGATFPGSALARSLVIGKSLNVGTTPPSYHIDPTKVALSAALSYHSSLDLTQNVFIGFPFAAPPFSPGTFNDGAGVFNTSDYYLEAVDRGHVRDPDNRLI